MSVKKISVAALLTAIIYAQQVALAPFPNIQLCAVLVIVYTVHFGSMVPMILAGFILLEGLTFGFGMWWVSYLYIWPLLAFAVYLMRKNESPVIWACLAGFFGLIYGALCALPYLAAGGWSAAFSYWVSGIPFDIAHCVGNSVITFALWKPLSAAAKRLKKGIEN